jgi:hypothetical protein
MRSSIVVHGLVHVGGGGARSTASCAGSAGMMASARTGVVAGVVADMKMESVGTGIVVGGWEWASRLGGYVCLDRFVRGVDCCMRRRMRCGDCGWMLLVVF